MPAQATRPRGRLWEGCCSVHLPEPEHSLVLVNGIAVLAAVQGLLRAVHHGAAAGVVALLELCLRDEDVRELLHERVRGLVYEARVLLPCM